MRIIILALLLVGCSTRPPRVMSLSPWGVHCDGHLYFKSTDGPVVYLQTQGDLVFICSAYTSYRWQLSVVHPLAGYEGYGPKEIKRD